MQSFVVIVSHILRNGSLVSSESPGYSIQAFFLQGPVESFHVAVVAGFSDPAVPMSQS